MKVSITTKNFNPSDQMKNMIDKKFAKLGKYFSNDVEAHVTLSAERGRQKIEATIRTKGMIFRAEETANDMYVGIDRVVDKLSTQMSRFKAKLKSKFKDQKEMFLEELPEMGGPEPDEEKIVKRKKFDLIPMSVDEAIMQMELLGHSFYVFLNMETDSAAVIYKRNDGAYGLLDTTY